VAAVGKFTVKLIVVVRVTPPPLADTVMVDVPAGVVALVLIVNVDEQVGVQLAKEKEAVAPEGNPEAENVTDCVPLDTNVAVIELVVEEPAVSD
jgi:hypothetical protein